MIKVALEHRSHRKTSKLALLADGYGCLGVILTLFVVWRTCEVFALPAGKLDPLLLTRYTTETAAMSTATSLSAESTVQVSLPGPGLEFIDTSFENASPLWYDIAADGTINVHLLYD